MEPKEDKKIPKLILSLVNFWPAALVVVLLMAALPSTIPVLKQIPELLVLEETEAAEPKPALPDLIKGEEEEEALADSGRTYTDGVYTGSSRGYGGDIKVQVTVAGGKITDIQILSAAGETSEFLSQARKVIDRVLQAQTWEVDAVSGATYSSRGILGAIRNAITGEKVENALPPEKPSPKGSLKKEKFDANAVLKDGVYTGTAMGFGGNITVEVTIKGGKIAAIRVLNHSGESDSYYNRAKKVIDRILSKGTPNVDTVSGATYSSNGIINAVKRALQKAAKGGGKAAADEQGQLPQPAAPVVDNTEEPDVSNGFNDGTYIVDMRCTDNRMFDYTIRLTMTVADGKIQSINAQRLNDISDNPDMNEKYLGYAVSGRVLNGKNYSGVHGQIIAAQSTKGVGVVSGATYSSNAILKGAKQLFAQAAKNKEAVENPEDDGKDTEPGDNTGTGDDTKPGDDQKPEEEPDPEDPEAKNGLEDGTYTMDAVCVDEDPSYPAFEYTVRVTMQVENGEISAVDAEITEDQSEDPDYNQTLFDYAKLGRTRGGKEYKGVIAQILTNQTTKDIDTVSGATYSSRTIIDTVKKLIGQAAKDDPGEEGSETGKTDDSGSGKTDDAGQGSSDDSGSGKTGEEGSETGKTDDSGSGKTDDAGQGSSDDSGSGKTDEEEETQKKYETVNLRLLQSAKTRMAFSITR